MKTVRHHTNEFILRAVFETEIHQAIISSNIPIFKNLKKIWHNMHINKYNSKTEDDKAC